MCHAIVEIRFRSDLDADDPSYQYATDETHLADLVTAFQANDQIIRIRVYRPDARWDRVEKWELEE